MHRTARTLLFLLLFLATACTTAAGARRAELRRALDQARVSRAPSELWPDLLRFLHERGYPLVGDDRLAVGLGAQGSLSKLFSPGFATRVREDGSRLLETNGEERSGARVRAEALAVAGGGARLRITVLKPWDTNPHEYSEWRDEELELALLERLDPAAAARVAGREPPPPAPAPGGDAAAVAAGTAAGPDRWEPLRGLLGSWEGTLPGGTPVRWRFELAAGGQFVELRGSPLRFAGPPEPSGAGEELGRISRDAAGGRMSWHQFTVGGRVDRYQVDLSRPGAIVLLAEEPAGPSPGARTRLTLGRDGDAELLAILELADPGKDFAVAGEVRLKRVR